MVIKIQNKANVTSFRGCTQLNMHLYYQSHDPDSLSLP